MLLPVVRNLSQEKGVRLLQALEGDELIGLRPVATAHRHGRLPLANITNWMHQHCFYGAPLIRRGYEGAAWTSFLDVLDKSDWAPNFLHLSTLDGDGANANALKAVRSEEHTSELQSLMRISYAVFCLKKKNIHPSSIHQQANTN